MDDTRTYVEARLRRELENFQRRGIGQEVTELSVYEKVLIYKYSLDGYEGLNEALRSGREHPMERLLNEALDKLPDFKGYVFRGRVLSTPEKNKYAKALEENTEVFDLGFLSTSTSKQIAESFSRGDTLFEIYGLHGKTISALSFYGANSPFNEKEVLFKSKTRFNVMKVSTSGRKTVIILEEAET